MTTSQKPQSSRKMFRGALALLFITFAALMVLIARGPDVELHFKREIKSELTPERLDAMIASTSRWPSWFYTLRSATILSEPTAMVKSGSRVLFQMDPNKGEYKKFTLEFLVKTYTPGKLIELELVDDSSQRLTGIFEHLNWRIEVLPDGTGSLIRGTASARTRHWRSRLLGSLAERIVMNQVFYPNLIVLSELKQPFSLEPSGGPRGRDRSSLW